MVRILRGRRGLTLVEVLVGAAMIGGVALVSASLITSQSTSSQYIAAKTAALELGEQLNMVMNDPANCSCQLNPDLTADNSNDPALYWAGAVTDGSARISVKVLKVGCDIASPVVARETNPAGPHLTVSAVDFVDLRPTGTAGEWTGKFRVSFAQAAGKVQIAPVEIGQIVSVAPGGPPGMARVNACKGTPASGGGGGGGGPVTDCGVLAMMGPPGGQGTYCIERNLHPAADFFSAKLICGGPLPPGYPPGAGPGYICQHSDYYLACKAGLLDPLPPQQHVWLGNFDTEYDLTAYAQNANDCDGLGFKELRVNHTGPLVGAAYRCCWR